VLRYDWSTVRAALAGFAAGWGCAEADCHLRVDGSRLFAPPWGLEGGEAGGRGAFNFSDGVMLTGARRAALHAGDTVEIVTPGGYGPPAFRDPESVARDLADRRVPRPASQDPG
jgi:N-methylhydantoinase B